MPTKVLVKLGSGLLCVRCGHLQRVNSQLLRRPLRGQQDLLPRSTDSRWLRPDQLRCTWCGNVGGKVLPPSEADKFTGNTRELSLDKEPENPNWWWEGPEEDYVIDEEDIPKDSTPHIREIWPLVPRAGDQPQIFKLYGDFDIKSRVYLANGSMAEPLSLAPTFVSDSRIHFEVMFREARADWSVLVVSPDGVRSDLHVFEVCR